jgi:hypothetical protein
MEPDPTRDPIYSPGRPGVDPVGRPLPPVIEAEVEEPKNRVQWGPIVAGTLTALVTLLVLAVLGLAVGASAFEPGTDRTDWGTAAGIWGAISALIAFFLGGWVAARTAAVAGSFAGLMNGFMVGAATLLVLLWLTTTGLTNLLGFAANSVADIAAVATEVIGEEATELTDEVDVEEAVEEAEAAAPSAESVYDRVRDGAWGTLIVLLLSLATATLGGWLGRNEQFGWETRPR